MENKFNGAFRAFSNLLRDYLGEFVNCTGPSSLIQRNGKEMMGESSPRTQVDPKSPRGRLIEGGQLPAKLMGSIAVYLINYHFSWRATLI